MEFCFSLSAPNHFTSSQAQTWLHTFYNFTVLSRLFLFANWAWVLELGPGLSSLSMVAGGLKQTGHDSHLLRLGTSIPPSCSHDWKAIVNSPCVLISQATNWLSPYGFMSSTLVVFLVNVVRGSLVIYFYGFRASIDFNLSRTVRVSINSTHQLPCTSLN